MWFTLLFAALVSSQTADEWLAKGQKLRDEGRLAEASEALRSAAEADSNDPRPRFELGTLLFEMGRFDEAASELTVALELDPENAVIRIGLARAHFRSGQPESVIARLAPLITKESTNAAMLALQGNALAQLGRSAEAIPYLEKAVSLEPKRVQALFYLARSLLDQGQIAQAAERFQGGVELPPPHNIRFEVGLAEATLRLGEPDTAYQSLESLLKRHPRAARGWYLKGVIEVQRKNYRAAATAFEKAIAEGYANAQAFLDLGVALASAGDSRGAREAVDRSLQTDPELAAAHYYKGIFTLEDGEPLREPGANRPNPLRSEAIEHFDRAASLAKQPSLRLSLAEAYLRVRRYEQAIEVAQSLLNLPGTSAQAHFVMARAQHELLDTEAAEVSYQNAIAGGLATPEVYLNLGRLQMAVSQFEQAEKTLSLGLDIAPNHGALQLQRGMAAIKLGNGELARESLERAAELWPDNPEVWYQRGIAASQDGSSQVAVESWERALELAPKKTSVYFRLGGELTKLGRAPEARRYLEEFRKRSEEDKQRKVLASQLWPLLRSGQEAAEEGKLQEARERFQRAVELAPDEAPAYLYLSELHLGLGEFEEAARTLLTGLERLPNNVHLLKLLIRVYEASGEAEAAEERQNELRQLLQKKEAPEGSLP